jgi:hypothetical protein
MKPFIHYDGTPTALYICDTHFQCAFSFSFSFENKPGELVPIHPANAVDRSGEGDLRNID